jgi:hypothetical protein
MGILTEENSVYHVQVGRQEFARQLAMMIAYRIGFWDI